MATSTDHKLRKSVVCSVLLSVTAFMLFTAEPTTAQSQRPSSDTSSAYFNSERAIRSSRRSNKIDVSGSGFFTDFTENIRVTKDVPELQLSDSQSSGRLWRLMSGSSAAGAFNVYDNTAGAYRLTINSSGNVGIGTTSPQAKLQVNKTTTTSYSSTSFGDSADYNFFLGTNSNSNGDFSALRFSDAGAGYRESLFGVLQNANGQGDFFFKGYTGSAYSEYLRITSSGNVGIGTSAPAVKLHVESPSSTTIRIVSTGDNVAYQRIAGLTGDWYAGLFTSADYSIGDITNSGATYLTIKQTSGKVGIGKTNPDVALDVVGDIKASGVIHAKYQDVAEWVESSEQLAAGTVVVLDSTKSNQVISSSQSYDTRVAGVISAQPGITLGEKGDRKVLVATTGRVKVKVDATKSPIQIGDLLVTSDIPGMAMKSEPIKVRGRLMHMPGTLIGKALEPLEKGSGRVLVLLSLQ